MAQYYGILSGGRGEATRTGHKSTGLRCEARGWHSGVKVYANYDEEHKQDTFTVYHTSGSGSGDHIGYLFTLRDDMTREDVAAELERAARAIRG